MKRAAKLFRPNSLEWFQPRSKPCKWVTVKSLTVYSTYPISFSLFKCPRKWTTYIVDKMTSFLCRIHGTHRHVQEFKRFNDGLFEQFIDGSKIQIQADGETLGYSPLFYSIRTFVMLLMSENKKGGIFTSNGFSKMLWKEEWVQKRVGRCRFHNSHFAERGVHY